jgi:hypothetical protein
MQVRVFSAHVLVTVQTKELFATFLLSLHILMHLVFALSRRRDVVVPIKTGLLVSRNLVNDRLLNLLVGQSVQVLVIHRQYLI